MRIFVLWVLFSALSLGIGCASSRIVNNSRVPEIAIDESGIITFNDKQLKLGNIASALRSAGYERTQEINILIPDRPDHSIMKKVSSELVRSGYTRTVFVKQRKALSALAKPK